jgi:hypothetical protein
MEVAKIIVPLMALIIGGAGLGFFAGKKVMQDMKNMSSIAIVIGAVITVIIGTFNFMYGFGSLIFCYWFNFTLFQVLRDRGMTNKFENVFGLIFRVRL